MKTFTVIWFYIANHGRVVVEAKDAEQAIQMATGFFSDDFRQKARIMVFEGTETLHLLKGEVQ